MSGRSAVVYLARAAEPLASIRRFASSYARNSSGQEHDLVVIWKGGDHASAAPDHIVSLFAKGPTRFLQVADDGIDITAYAYAASVLPHSNLCFFNTHTEIVAPNWLRYLSDASTYPDVGIVGGTGSFESLKDGFQIVSKIAWLRERGVAFDKRFYRRWSPIVGKEIIRQKRRSLFQRSREAFLDATIGLRPAYPSHLDGEFETHWGCIASPYEHFPSFPNPHIRTNGFLIKRQLFLQCLGDVIPQSKSEAYEFESGTNSLTRQLLDKGLRALIVNSDGRTFDIENWKASQTFRLGYQRKLLFKDNQTRSFDAMKKRKRVSISQMTWGLDGYLGGGHGETKLPSVSAWQETNFVFRVASQTKRLFGS